MVKCVNGNYAIRWHIQNIQCLERFLSSIKFLYSASRFLFALAGNPFFLKPSEFTITLFLLLPVTGMGLSLYSFFRGDQGILRHVGLWSNVGLFILSLIAWILFPLLLIDYLNDSINSSV